MNDYFVYIAQCSDNTLYSGITTDLHRRIREHNGELFGGAKYTKNRRPIIIVYSETASSRSAASTRECELKKLSRTEKLQLIKQSVISTKNKKPLA